MAQFIDELLQNHEVDEFGRPVSPKNAFGQVIGNESTPFLNEFAKMQRDPLPSDFSAGTESDLAAVNFDKQQAQYRIGDDFSERQHEQQGYGEILGNGLVRLVGSTALKAGQGIGYLGALAGGLAQGAVEGTELSQIIANAADNTMSEMFTNWENDLKDRFEIFDSNKYKHGGIAGQLTSAKFWADEFVDGVAFMASTYIPGGLINKAAGAVNVGARAASAGHKISRGLRKAALGEASAVSLPKLANVANKIDKGNLLVSMTAMEAMFEAKGVKDSILSDPHLQSKYSGEELKKIAAERARDAFMMNMAALSFSNAIEINALTKLASKTKTANKVSRTNRGVDVALKSGKAKATDLKGLAKYTQSPNALGARDIVATTLSEGFYEENIQNTIEQLNHRRAEEKQDGYGFGELVNEFITPGKQGYAFNFDNEEKVKSIILGSIIGGGSTTVLNAAGKGARGQAKEDRENAENLAKRVNDSAANLTKLDIFTHKPDRTIEYTVEVDGLYKTEGENKVPMPKEEWTKEVLEHGLDEEKGGTATIAGAVEIDPDTNTPLVDKAKLERWLSNQGNLSELTGIINALSTEPERNKFALKLLEKERIGVWARNHFNAGLGQELQDRLEYMKRMTPEEVSLFGEPREDLTDYISELQEYTLELEELHNSMASGLVTPTNATTETVAKWKEMTYDLGARMIATDTVIRDLERENFATQSKVLGVSAAEIQAEELDYSNIQQELLTAQRGLSTLLASTTKVTPTDETMRKIEEQENKIKEAEEALKAVRPDLRKQLIADHPHQLAIARNNTKIQQLRDSREGMTKEWNNLTDIVGGYKYFENNQSVLTQKYKPARGGVLKLSAKTTKAEYAAYEAKRVRRMKMRDTLAVSMSKSYSEVLEAGDIDSGNLIPFLEGLMEDKPALTEAALEQLEQYKEQVDNIKKNNAKAVEIAKTTLEDAQMENIQFDAGNDVASLTLAVDEAIKIERDFDTKNPVLAAFAEGWPVLRKELEATQSIKSEEHYQRRVFNEFLEETNRLRNLVNQDNFTGLEDINKQIVRLQQLKRLIKGRGGLFSTAQSNLDSDIDALENWSKTVTERLQDRALQAHRVRKSMSDTIMSIFNDQPELVEILRTAVPEFDSIMEEAIEERKNNKSLPLSYINPIYFSIIFEKVEDPQVMEDVMTRIKINGLAKLRDSSAVRELQKTSTLQSATESAITGVENSATRGANGLINILADNGLGIQVDAIGDSPVFKYLLNGDILKLVETIGSRDDTSAKISNDQIKEVAKILQELIGVEAITRMANNRLSPSTVLNRQLNHAKLNKDKASSGSPFEYSPTLQQDLAIAEIANFVNEPHNEEGRPFDNWIVLFGYSSTGKSSVVASQGVTTVGGVSTDKVFSAGHTQESTDNIANSMKSPHKGTIDELTMRVELDTVPDGVEVLVVDEVAYLKQHELIKLANAVASSKRNFKVVALGDPNQITPEAGTPAIASLGGNQFLPNIENIRIATPLTIKLRSDVPIINDIQNSYLGMKAEVEGVVGKTSVPTEDVATTTERLVGAYVEESDSQLMAILSNSFKNFPKVTRMVIVADRNAKLAMMKKLADAFGNNHGIDVKEYGEAQGLTRGEVYSTLKREDFLATKDFNDAMHVATSRPRYFLYAANMPKSSNLYQSDMMDQVKENLESKSDNFDEFIASKELDKKIYSKWITTPPSAPPAATPSAPATPAAPTTTTSPTVPPTPPAPTAPSVPDDTEPDSIDALFGPPTAGKITSSPKPESNKIESTIDEQLDNETDHSVTPNTPLAELEPVEETVNHVSPTQMTNLKDNEIPADTAVLAHSEQDAFRPVYDTVTDNMLFPPLYSLEETETEEAIPGLLELGHSGEVEYHFVNNQLLVGVRHNGVVRRLAVLSRDEVANHAKSALFLEHILGNKPTLTTHANSNRGIFTPTGPPLHVAKLSMTSTPMKYKYKKQGVRLADKGLQEVFSKWEDSYTDGKGLANTSDVIDNLVIKIFTNNEIAKIHTDNLSNSYVPSAGIPYLVISGHQMRAKTPSGRGKTSQRPQYIPLEARRMNKTLDKHLIEPITTFGNDVYLFSEELKALNTDASMAHGSRALSELVYALSEIANRFNEATWDSDFIKKFDILNAIPLIGEAEGHLSARIEAAMQSGKLNTVMNYATKIDEAVHGTWEERRKALTKSELARRKKELEKLQKDDKAFALLAGEELETAFDKLFIPSERTYSKRNFQGKAQKALDRIARANLIGNKHITQEESAFSGVILREVREGTGFSETIYGRRLLHPQEKRPALNKGRLEESVQKAYESYNEKNDGAAVKIDPKLINEYTEVITFTELVEVFAEDNFDGEGNSTNKAGEGLRVPITLNSTKSFDKDEDGKISVTPIKLNSNTKKSNALLGNLTSRFDSIAQTQISIIDPEANGPLPPATPATPTSEEKLSDDIKEENPPRNDNKPGDDSDFLFDMDAMAASKERIDASRIGKEVTPEAAQKLINKYNPSTLKSIIFRLIGKKTPSVRNAMRMVDALAITKMAGKEVWGLYKDGVRYFEANARGNTYENIVKHETFHHIANSYLTKREYDQMIQVARQEGFRGSPKQIEEQLAELFQEWKTGTQVPSILERIFRKILQFLGFASRHFDSIDSLFENIGDGVYGGVPRREATGTLETMVKINEDYQGRYDLFKKARNLFLLNLQAVRRDTKKYGVMTQEEAVGYTIDVLKNRWNYIDNIRKGYTTSDGTVVAARELNQAEFDFWLGFKQLVKNNSPGQLDFLNHIYPGLERKDLDDGDMGALQLDGELAEEDEVSKFMAYFSTDQSTVDHRTKLVSIVKEALVSISITKEVNGKKSIEFIPFGQAFNLITYSLQGVDTRDLVQAAEHVKSRIVSDSLSPQAQATAIFMGELIEKVNQYNAKHTFSDNDTFVIGENAHQSIGITAEITRDPNSTTEEFLSKIEQQSDLTRDEIVNAFKQYEAKQLFSAMMVTIGSLRERKLFSGVKSVDKDGNSSFNYFRTKGSSVQNIIRTNLQATLLNKLRNTNKAALLTEELDAEIRGLKKSGNKNKVAEVTTKVLRHWGLLPGDLFINLSKSDAALIRDRLMRFTETYSRATPDIELDTLSSTYATMFNTMSKALTGYNKSARPSNSIRADGKVVYRWVRSNYAHQTMDWFVNENGAQKSKIKPAHLDSKFMQHNIYQRNETKGTPGLSRIYEIIDHDGVQQRENSQKSAVMYANESPKQWLERTFTAQFSTFTKFNAGKYIQNFWTISNKPTMSGAVVDIMSEELTDQGFQSLIDQEKDRPEKDRLKTYKNRSYLVGQTVQEIKDVLEKDIDEMTDLLMQEKGHYSFDLEGTYSSLITSGVLHGDKVKIPTKLTKSIAKQIYARQIGLKSIPQSDPVFEESFKQFLETQEYADAIAENKRQYREAYKSVVRTFLYNHYIQSHQLNQIVFGDQAHFKNALDIIKRTSISFGPGMKAFVHHDIGTPPKMNVIIANDLQHKLGNLEKVAKDIIGSDVEVTDAQGYITKQAYEQLKAGYGIDSELDDTLKPVYFGIDENGTPVALKLSLVVLNDKLLANPRFAKLKELNQIMKDGNQQMLVFDSGAKVGAPRRDLQAQFEAPGENLNDAGDRMSTLGEKDAQGALKDSISIDMNNFRLQLNPSHDVQTRLANPSQLLYFTGVWKETTRSSSMLNRAVANIVAAGRRKMSIDLRLTDKGNIDKKHTKNKIIQDLINTFGKTAGSELEAELLSALKGKNVIDIPTVTNKIISAINSQFKSNTVKFRLRGADLVLMSEAFTYDKRVSKLKWRNEKGNAEALVPLKFKELGYKEGDVIYGFRLPSTGIHSSAPVEIKGFFEGEGKNSNLIILPSEVTKFHGADYDIDVMHSIYKEFFTSPDGKGLDISNILMDIDPVAFKDGYILEEGSDLIDAIPMFEKAFNLIKEARNDDNRLTSFERLDKIEKTLIKYYQMANRNHMVDIYIQMAQDLANRHLMLNLVSMDRLNGKTEENGEETVFDMLARLRGFTEGNRNEYLFGDINLERVLHQQRIHFNTFSGNTMTGIAATFSKGAAHVVMGAKPTKWEAVGGKVYTEEERLALREKDDEGNLIHKQPIGDLMPIEREEPKLSSDNEIIQSHLDDISIGGVKYDSIVENEYDSIVDGKRVMSTVEEGQKVTSVWETLDSLINAAIDNVKEQILAVTNLSNRNADSFLAAVALGIPIHTITLLFNQPKVLEITNERFESLTVDTVTESMSEIQKELIYKEALQVLAVRGIVSITDELLAMPRDTFMEAHKEAISKFSKEIHENVRLDLEGDVNAKELSSVYSYYWDQEKLKHREVNSHTDLITQYKALKTIRGLIFAGTSIQSAATVAAPVKDIPPTYSGVRAWLNHLLTKVAGPKKSSFSGTIDRVEDNLEAILDKVPSIQEIQDPVKKYKVKQTAAKMLLKQDYSTRLVNRSIENSTLGAKQQLDTEVSEKFMFQNSNLLSIPNIYESYRVMLNLERVLSQITMRNSAQLQLMSDEIVKDLGLTDVDSDLRSNNLKKDEEIEEHIRAEFIKYMMTDLSIMLDGEQLDLSTDNTEPYETEFFTYTGRQAFEERLADALFKAKSERADESNLFLDNLSVESSNTGEISLVFTADKTADPLEAVMYKNAFKSLKNEDGTWSDLQKDLLKYSILKEGMSFSRRSYARVIPEELFAAVVTTMQDKLEAIFENTNNALELSDVAKMVKNDFTVQFLNNNFSMIPANKFLKVEPTTNKIAKLEKGEVYHDATMSPKVYYTAPKIVKKGGYIYFRLDDVPYQSDNPSIVKTPLYRRLLSVNNTEGYKLDLDHLVTNRGYDLRKILNPVKPSLIKERFAHLDNIRGEKVLVLSNEGRLAATIETLIGEKATAVPGGAPINMMRGEEINKSLNMTVLESAVKAALHQYENCK